MVKAEYGKLVAAVLQTSRPDAWDPQMGLILLRIKLPGRRGFTFSCSPSVCFGNSVEGKGRNRLTISPKVCLLGGALVNVRACGQKRARPAPPIPAGPVPTPPLTPLGPTKSWKLNDWRGLADLPKLSTDCNPLGLPTTHPRSSRNFWPNSHPYTLHMPPPPIIPIPLVAKAIRSFSTGTGPGPDGLRADLLKALMGNDEDGGILPLYRDLVGAIASGWVGSCAPAAVAGGWTTNWYW